MSSVILLKVFVVTWGLNSSNTLEFGIDACKPAIECYDSETLSRMPEIPSYLYYKKSTDLRLRLRLRF